MAARGFCGDGSQKPYFDIRVFNPCAQTYLTMEPHIVYLRQEKEKRRQYQQRICEVEHGSFTPLVLSTNGQSCKCHLRAACGADRGEAQRGLFTSCRVDKNTRVFFTSAVIHNSTSRLSHQEDWVHFSASSSVGSERVPSSLNFVCTSNFFIQLVWFSSVSHTFHYLLLSTESCPFVCESLSNLLC